MISKKKKKKVFAKIQSDFSAEIQNSNVFFAQNQVISKKKKGLRQNSRRFFFQNFASLNVSGGAIFNFSQKIGLKSTKNMRFCILHKPMGEARAPPPPPGYATGFKAIGWPEQFSSGSEHNGPNLHYEANFREILRDGKGFFACFVDLEKAYDRVLQNMLYISRTLIVSCYAPSSHFTPDRRFVFG